MAWNYLSRLRCFLCCRLLLSGEGLLRIGLFRLRLLLRRLARLVLRCLVRLRLRLRVRLRVRLRLRRRICRRFRSCRLAEGERDADRLFDKLK